MADTESNTHDSKNLTSTAEAMVTSSKQPDEFSEGASPRKPVNGSTNYCDSKKHLTSALTNSKMLVKDPVSKDLTIETLANGVMEANRVTDLNIDCRDNGSEEQGVNDVLNDLEDLNNYIGRSNSQSDENIEGISGKNKKCMTSTNHQWRTMQESSSELTCDHHQSVDYEVTTSSPSNYLQGVWNDTQDTPLRSNSVIVSTSTNTSLESMVDSVGSHVLDEYRGNAESNEVGKSYIEQSLEDCDNVSMDTDEMCDDGNGTVKEGVELPLQSSVENAMESLIDGITGEYIDLKNDAVCVGDVRMKVAVSDAPNVINVTDRPLLNETISIKHSIDEIKGNCDVKIHEKIETDVQHHSGDAGQIISSKSNHAVLQMASHISYGEKKDSSCEDAAITITGNEGDTDIVAGCDNKAAVNDVKETVISTLFPVSKVVHPVSSVAKSDNVIVSNKSAGMTSVPVINAFSSTDSMPQPPPLKRAPSSVIAVEGKKMVKVANKMNDLRPTVQFLYDIGLSLAKQVVYRELIDTQKAKEKTGKLDKDGLKQLERLCTQSSETDERTDHLRFKSDKKCSGCSFRTESQNVLYWHKEHPHEGMREELNCANCTFTTWHRLKFTQHIEQRHGMQGRLYPKVCMYKCTTCHYETNAKNNFFKHSVKCGKTFNIRFNLIPSSSLHVNFSFSEGFFKVSNPNKVDKQKKPDPPPLHIAPVNHPVTNTVSLLKPGTALQLQNRLLRPPIIGHAGFRQQANTTGIRTTTNMPNFIRSPIILPDGKILIPQGSVVQNQMLRQVRPVLRGSVPLRPAVTTRAPTPMRFFKAQQSVPMPKPTTLINTLNSKPVANPQPVVVTPATDAKPAPEKVTSTIQTIGDYALKNNLLSCEICGGFVKDRVALRVHFHFAHKINLPLTVVEPDSKPAIPCKQCKLRFWTRSGLALHMKSTRHAAQHRPIGVCIYACFVCKQKVQYLLNHLSAVHNLTLADFVNARRCCICNMSFSQNAELMDHLKKVHVFELTSTGESIGIKSAPAGIIAPTTYSQKILKQKSQCTLCKANFANNTLLTQHCMRMHVNCTRCGIVFKNHEAYKTHTCKYAHNAPMICQVCNRTFTAKKFRTHVELTHIKPCRVNLKRQSEAEIDNMIKYPRIDVPQLKNAVFEPSHFTARIQSPVMDEVSVDEMPIVIDSEEEAQ